MDYADYFSFMRNAKQTGCQLANIAQDNKVE